MSTRSTVVIAGLLSDPPIAAARAAVQRLGLTGRFIDLAEQVPAVDWDDVSGFYLRGFGAADPIGTYELRHRAEATPRSVRVVNRVRASATNMSKPAQAIWIAQAGFDVPQGLLTTDPDEARAFIARHGRAIVKSTSAVRSIVREVSADEDFAAVAWCPTQFQALVPGDEYRAHIVGNRVFAHRVYSDAVDYRYGGAAIVPAALPPDIATRCVALARRLGLELAGLDVRHTPDGRWVCFEANTSPVWSAYDADDVIADALVRHLAGN